jgi:hypothetical protein
MITMLTQQQQNQVTWYKEHCTNGAIEFNIWSPKKIREYPMHMNVMPTENICFE